MKYFNFCTDVKLTLTLSGLPFQFGPSGQGQTMGHAESPPDDNNHTMECSLSREATETSADAFHCCPPYCTLSCISRPAIRMNSHKSSSNHPNNSNQLAVPERIYLSLVQPSEQTLAEDDEEEIMALDDGAEDEERVHSQHRLLEPPPLSPHAADAVVEDLETTVATSASTRTPTSRLAPGSFTSVALCMGPSPTSVPTAASAMSRPMSSSSVEGLLLLNNPTSPCCSTTTTGSPTSTVPSISRADSGFPSAAAAGGNGAHNNNFSQRLANHYYSSPTTPSTARRNGAQKGNSTTIPSIRANGGRQQSSSSVPPSTTSPGVGLDASSAFVSFLHQQSLGASQRLQRAASTATVESFNNTDTTWGRGKEDEDAAANAAQRPLDGDRDGPSAAVRALTWEVSLDATLVFCESYRITFYNSNVCGPSSSPISPSSHAAPPPSAAETAAVAAEEGRGDGGSSAVKELVPIATREGTTASDWGGEVDRSASLISFSAADNRRRMVESSMMLATCQAPSSYAGDGVVGYVDFEPSTLLCAPNMTYSFPIMPCGHVTITASQDDGEAALLMGLSGNAFGLRGGGGNGGGATRPLALMPAASSGGDEDSAPFDLRMLGPQYQYGSGHADDDSDDDDDDDDDDDCSVDGDEVDEDGMASASATAADSDDSSKWLVRNRRQQNQTKKKKQRQQQAVSTEANANTIFEFCWWYRTEANGSSDGGRMSSFRFRCPLSQMLQLCASNLPFKFTMIKKKRRQTYDIFIEHRPMGGSNMAGGGGGAMNSSGSGGLAELGMAEGCGTEIARWISSDVALSSLADSDSMQQHAAHCLHLPLSASAPANSREQHLVPYGLPDLHRSAFPYSVVDYSHEPYFGLLRMSVLGAGGEGEVTKRIDRFSREMFAVKTMSRESSARKRKGIDDKKAEALRHQIDVICDLPRHYNIVQHYDFLVDDKFIYIKMECVRGQSIAKLLHEGHHASFDEGAVRFFGRQIVQGLAFLHRNGIIHRDIKGANVMIDDEGVAKITDFGIAVGAKMGSDTLRNAPLGTPGFMAPELCDESVCYVSSKCDVWSVACTIVEMATGKAPTYGLHDTDAYVLMRRIASCGHGPMLPTNLSRQGHDFLERCFTLDPACRMSAEECLAHPFLSTPFVQDSEDPAMQPPTPRPGGGGVYAGTLNNDGGHHALPESCDDHHRHHHHHSHHHHHDPHRDPPPLPLKGTAPSVAGITSKPTHHHARHSSPTTRVVAPAQSVFDIVHRLRVAMAKEDEADAEYSIRLLEQANLRGGGSGSTAGMPLLIADRPSSSQSQTQSQQQRPSMYSVLSSAVAEPTYTMGSEEGSDSVTLTFGGGCGGGYNSSAGPSWVTLSENPNSPAQPHPPLNPSAAKLLLQRKSSAQKLK